MSLLDICFMLLFAMVFNWAVNMQVLAHYEKQKRDKIVAITLAFLAAVVLGFLSRV